MIFQTEESTFTHYYKLVMVYVEKVLPYLIVFMVSILPFVSAIGESITNFAEVTAFALPENNYIPFFIITGLIIACGVYFNRKYPTRYVKDPDAKYIDL
jgi:hypothetical protein